MAREQLGVLNALDAAKTQWYHFTAIVIAGMGFFTDAYDLFCISLVTKLLGRIYYHVDGALKPGTLPPNVAAAVNGVALVGTLVGQLFFEFMKRHGLHLLGTTTTWFLLDIAFYSQNLFQKDIFSAIGWIPKAANMNAIHEVYKIARAQTLIALCSTVLGYWFTVALIDIMGRFAIQLMGFFFMTVFMFALAIPYHHWTLEPNRIGFVIMYSLTFFFANFGPNATTFVVPAEIVPARLRSTCHGISAAAGKAGAIVGAFGFLYAAQSTDPAKTDTGYPPGIGVRYSLIMLGVINFFGMLFTLLVPESKGKSLEELTGENRDENDEKQIQMDPSRTVPI
ncbi:hypothetical protein GOBAR_AA02355 [Gossypium barbadense]|uniref:Major facilitator superfamily (MFS) profile domain-containing protein n=1 Tax=Gossypium barbadense TaxID=3634 RepID=A0A2P5YRM3_GOSBA|nr:hypothetical protein GOBAR_AA02355 [Gossypium barbadense]